METPFKNLIQLVINVSLIAANSVTVGLHNDQSSQIYTKSEKVKHLKRRFDII